MDEIEVDKTPLEILYDPLLNKGTAFTRTERKELGLLGLLPHSVSTIEEQVKRRYANFHNKRSDIGKYKMLTALQDRNEVLFFRMLHEYAEEMLSFIYTPTVGEASVVFSEHYSQNRGIYLCIDDEEHLEKIIENIPRESVDVIVVTDGSRILGLGDVGVGGMVIPVGKLALYTLFGGIHPGRVLPVMLDTGTDNEQLLQDPLYLGWRHPRVRGERYFQFVDRFVSAISKRYPKVLLQWEDFEKDHAYKLLIDYKEKICSFNDDIQGTASSVLAGVMAAIKTKKVALKEQRIAILGGGSAGMGIATILSRALMKEGLSFDQARQQIYVIDRGGLLKEGGPGLNEIQQKFAHKNSELSGWSVGNINKVLLEDVVSNAKINILIGVCAQPGAFTREIVSEMYAHDSRPIIFPLSNPTSKAEAAPADLLQWTRGGAIVATGSPFAPVTIDGRTYPISQCNNVYIFPGLGLGAVSVKAKEITPEMFIKAADVLSTMTLDIREDETMLFPRFRDLRTACRRVAIGVAQMAIDAGLATQVEGSAEEMVDRHMWLPEYPKIKKKRAR